MKNLSNKGLPVLGIFLCGLSLFLAGTVTTEEVVAYEEVLVQPEEDFHLFGQEEVQKDLMKKLNL